MTQGIFVFGDLHLGKPTAPGPAWATWAMDEARALGATACVCAGDIIHRTISDDDPAYGQVLDVMGHALDVFDEVHFIAGNHDVNLDFELPAGVVVHPTEPHSFLCAGAVVHTAAVATDPDPREVRFPPREDASAEAHLGILHSSVTGEFSKKPCLPISLDDLVACGYDAWILAHVHVPHVLSTEPFVGWVGMGEGLLYWPAERRVQRLATPPS